jgi:hypothetical protein
VSLARENGSDCICIQSGADHTPVRLAGSRKPRIVYNGYVLIGNETKGFQRSQYEAMPQGFEIGGDFEIVRSPGTC